MVSCLQCFYSVQRMMRAKSPGSECLTVIKNSQYYKQRRRTSHKFSFHPCLLIVFHILYLSSSHLGGFLCIPGRLSPLWEVTGWGHRVLESSEQTWLLNLFASSIAAQCPDVMQVKYLRCNLGKTLNGKCLCTFCGGGGQEFVTWYSII